MFYNYLLSLHHFSTHNNSHDCNNQYNGNTKNDNSYRNIREFAAIITSVTWKNVSIVAQETFSWFNISRKLYRNVWLTNDLINILSVLNFPHLIIIFLQDVMFRLIFNVRCHKIIEQLHHVDVCFYYREVKDININLPM